MRISDWSSDVCSSDLTTGTSTSPSAANHVKRPLASIAAPSGPDTSDQTSRVASPSGSLAVSWTDSVCPSSPATFATGEIAGAALDNSRTELGRAAWRERECQYV